MSGGNRCQALRGRLRIQGRRPAVSDSVGAGWASVLTCENVSAADARYVATTRLPGTVGEQAAGFAERALQGLAGLVALVCLLAAVALVAREGDVQPVELALFGLALACLLLRVRLGALARAERSRHIVQALRERELLAATDPLTGLWNRRLFDEALQRERERARRAGTSFGLLLLDLDRFKAVNDSHGHEAGDRVLREAAARLAGATRAADLLARYGGDEFAVLAPDADRDALAVLAERLRRAVGGRPSTLADGSALTLTASIGAVLAHGSDPPEAAEALLGAADRLLYRAKAHGGDRIELAEREGERALQTSIDR